MQGLYTKINELENEKSEHTLVIGAQKRTHWAPAHPPDAIVDGDAYGDPLCHRRHLRQVVLQSVPCRPPTACFSPSRRVAMNKHSTEIGA